MDKVIALGTVACNIARKLEKHEQYDVYKIDHEDRKEKNYQKIKKYEKPEKYEQTPPGVKTLLKKAEGSVLFIVCGASSVAAASLVILQQIHKKCNVNILYIRPEVGLLGEKKRLQERMVFGILQEYTRSGLFDRIYLTSNESLDPLVQDASILGYHDSINDLISSTLHMINYFNHVDSVSDTFSAAPETARISTFGVLNIDTSEEKTFFPLDNVRETRYYYGIPEEDLKKDKTLHRKIVSQVKEKSTEDTKVSYGIFSTNYDTGYAYILYNSSFVQKA